VLDQGESKNELSNFVFKGGCDGREGKLLSKTSHHKKLMVHYLHPIFFSTKKNSQFILVINLFSAQDCYTYDSYVMP
jgi:hypothetical protein